MSSKAFLGVLMLDTRFPRVVGDAGNVDSYPYPARTHVVKGAGSLDIVKDGLPSKHLVESFCKAAQLLEFEGARAIVSSCGFLISVQNHIAEAVNIPVMVSALSLYSVVKKHDAGKPIGIITASKKSLGDEAIELAGINKKDVYIAGMEDCAAFANTFLRTKVEQSLTLDKQGIEQAVVKKAELLLAKHPQISSFILECGNLPPYSDAIQQATGLPVYSILDAADHLMSL